MLDLMLDLYYDAFSLANIIVRNKLSTREGIELLEKIYSEDPAFLHPKYRHAKRALMADVLLWIAYLVDESALEQDFKAMGKEPLREKHIPDNFNIDLLFMEMRLKIQVMGKQNYAKSKMRTLLHHCGYKRRTPALLEHLRDCMFFYHIFPSLRGGEECDLRDVGLDDMIIFRLL